MVEWCLRYSTFFVFLKVTHFPPGKWRLSCRQTSFMTQTLSYSVKRTLISRTVCEKTDYTCFPLYLETWKKQPNFLNQRRWSLALILQNADPLPTLRQIFKIRLQPKACPFLCVRLSIKIVLTCHTLAKIKHVKEWCLKNFTLFATEWCNCENYTP